ncbi:unnamed protein product [Nesidiocoris tenuis]|uniref:Uncharacterized protein n=1 Tax=Nesidiocoris tenuis TaxID=355587 RepID=A0A6H5GHK6_9HEMI|nr:unnamed protein product [Nesidiocoris tenuis]
MGRRTCDTGFSVRSTLGTVQTGPDQYLLTPNKSKPCDWVNLLGAVTDLSRTGLIEQAQ